MSQSPNVPPLHEMRAIWLTTIGGIDWPHSYAQSEISIAKQKQELTATLDKLAEAGFNTILLQTRVRATTIFPSDMEPWDGCLSGFPGKSPGYDALAFAIEECHKRGMKLHAWVVSIPIGKWNSYGCKNLRNTYPKLVKKIGDEGYMNPEESGTADYLARFCKDIVSRYDIDGIHLDYIRYPETWKVIKDRNAGRQNITRIVRAVHDAVKSTKQWVMMSCSPVGKYADTKRMWSHGWNARDAVCQDAALWLEQGLMDCLFPMMYFRGDNFYPFAIDWQERSSGKLVTPGLGIYFMHPREKNWPLQDITREMHVLRQYGMGTCMFRSKFFTDNTKGLYDYTKEAFSPQPSLQPAMAWYDAPIVARPTSLQATATEDDQILLSWTMQNPHDNYGNELQYNIYGSTSFPVNTTDAQNLLAVNIMGTSAIIPGFNSVRYFAVTATDRFGNESAPAQLYDESSDTGNQNVTPGKRQEEKRLGFPVPTLPHDGNRVILDAYDVTAGQLVVINSVLGNDQTSRIVKQDGSHTFMDIAAIQPGNYKVYFINRKGNRHLLGFLCINPEDVSAQKQGKKQPLCNSLVTKGLTTTILSSYDMGLIALQYGADCNAI